MVVPVFPIYMTLNLTLGLLGHGVIEVCTNGIIILHVDNVLLVNIDDLVVDIL